MRSSDWSSDVCSSDLVAAQEEALRSAQIDLGRTTIRAPISGRIVRSTYTTGALVSASQADPLTTIQRIDPIFVDIQQSSADVLRLRQQLPSCEVSREGGPARARPKQIRSASGREEGGQEGESPG